MNQFKVFLLIITVYLFLTVPVFSQNSDNAVYYFLGDKGFSAITGAENLITLHRLLYFAEDKFLPPALFTEDNFGKKSLGILYRVSKTMLIDLAPDHIGFLIQHEVFGHGARFREYGSWNNSYHLGPPFPYNYLAGTSKSSGWSERDTTRTLTDYEEMMITVSGSQASTLFANTLRTKWLMRGKIHYRETFLYYRTYCDLFLYIAETKGGEDGDIRNYINQINNVNNIYNESDYKLTINNLFAYSFLQLADPFLYYAAITYAYTYAFKGQKYFNMPMIPVGRVGYLPSVHMALAPYGPEIYSDHYLKIGDRLLYAYIRIGIPKFDTSFGLGFKTDSIIDFKFFQADFEFDCWIQPGLTIGGDSVRNTEDGFGLGGCISIKPQIPPRLSFKLDIGYKMDGFNIGQPLNRSLILRIGLGFKEEVSNN